MPTVERRSATTPWSLGQVLHDQPLVLDGAVPYHRVAALFHHIDESIIQIECQVNTGVLSEESEQRLRRMEISKAYGRRYPKRPRQSALPNSNLSGFALH